MRCTSPEPPPAFTTTPAIRRQMPSNADARTLENTTDRRGLPLHSLRSIGVCCFGAATTIPMSKLGGNIIHPAPAGSTDPSRTSMAYGSRRDGGDWRKRNRPQTLPPRATKLSVRRSQASADLSAEDCITSSSVWPCSCPPISAWPQASRPSTLCIHIDCTCSILSKDARFSGTIHLHFIGANERIL